MSFSGHKHPAWRGGAPRPQKPVPYNGYWYGAERPLVWQAPNSLYGDTTDVVSRAVWTTPLFNIRTDLDVGAGPDRGASTPIQRSTLMGIRYNLSVNLRTKNGTTVGTIGSSRLDSIRVYSLEFGSPTLPDDAYTTVGFTEVAIASVPVFTQEREDITSSFQQYKKTPTTVDFSTQLQWVPPGFLRYWGVCIVLDLVNPGTFDPSLNRILCSASMS